MFDENKLDEFLKTQKQIKVKNNNNEIKNIEDKLNKIETVFDYNREFDIFKLKLDVFINLKQGIKIGKRNNDINEEYEIYEPTYYQKISRWYYSENRYKTIEYLNHDFESFTVFLQKLLEKLDLDKFNLYGTIVYEINNFVKELIKGLYNLKKTYYDYKKMVATIDSIILTLLDFKKNSENCVEYNKKFKYSNVPNTLKIITRSNSFK